jgi:hypothetical protein
MCARSRCRDKAATGQSPNEKLQRGEVEPRLGASDGCFEVFGKAAVTIEPGEGAFDDPAAGKASKTDGVSPARHDLNGPAAEFGERVHQLVAGISAVGEEVAQPRKEVVNGRDDERSTIAVLHVGAMHLGADQQTRRVGDEVTLAAFDRPLWS